MPGTRMGDLHRFEQVFGLFQYRTDHARPVMSSSRPCKRDRRISGPSSTHPSEVYNRTDPRNISSSASRRTGKFLLALSAIRSEEHTSELQSLMRISSAVFCLKKTKI